MIEFRKAFDQLKSKLSKKVVSVGFVSKPVIAEFRWIQVDLDRFGIDSLKGHVKENRAG